MFDKRGSFSERDAKLLFATKWIGKPFTRKEKYFRKYNKKSFTGLLLEGLSLFFESFPSTGDSTENPTKGAKLNFLVFLFRLFGHPQHLKVEEGSTKLVSILN